MGVTALVMAGGKGTRMAMATEKPMLQVGSKTMLQHAVEAAFNSKHVDRVVVTVADPNSLTAHKARELGVEVLVTAGDGFEEDMRHAIKTLNLEEVLVVSSDLPFLTSAIVDKIIEEFRKTGKPSMAAMAQEATFLRLGLRPSYVFDSGNRLVPLGVNMIDGRRIEEDELEQAILFVDSDELTVNVNTPHELAIARGMATNRTKAHEA